MNKKNEKDSLFCSFCGKNQKEVKKLIAGPTVFVCDECVELCMDIIKEDNKNNKFKINQGEVISNVLPYIEHSIGYYSVALTFLFNLKNILTPVWTVIAYSHESPPKFKTIVEINAFSGDIVTEPYSENLNA